MKVQARFLGIDDGPFTFRDHRVRVVGVVTRGPDYVEGVLSTEVDVDGDDGTTALLRLLRRSRFRPITRAIFLNGVFLGGFNLADPERLSEELGIPCVALVRTAPRPRLVRAALQKASPKGWEERWRRIEELQPRRLPGFPLWATVKGTTLREAAAWVRATTVRGWIPEPLRLAHVIASGVARGESRGPA